MAPTLIDLFAGCGGLTAGFVRHGYTPVLAVEHNLHAAATYALNFGEAHSHWGDIADLDAVPGADVVVGGPPCQGFSNLGSKHLDDPRNRLWQQFLRVVRAARPQAFVIENVGRFRRSTEFALLLEQADHGVIADYTLTHGVLQAADYGTPQRRARTIVIGSRVGSIPLPPPTHRRGTWRTVRDAIADLPEQPDTIELPSTTVEVFDRRVPGPFKGRDLHFGRRPRELSLR
ncbi:MAG: DNA cytosine methyltransferase, partial [Pseudonocardia sp.]|nr:DNA cytosine methyltransferase [Pseudonocardia sp.]